MFSKFFFIFLLLKRSSDLKKNFWGKREKKIGSNFKLKFLKQNSQNSQYSVKQINNWTFNESNSQTVEQSKYLTIYLANDLAVEQLNSQTVWPFNCPTFEQPSQPKTWAHRDTFRRNFWGSGGSTKVAHLPAWMIQVRVPVSTQSQIDVSETRSLFIIQLTLNIK